MDLTPAMKRVLTNEEPLFREAVTAMLTGDARSLETLLAGDPLDDLPQNANFLLRVVEFLLHSLVERACKHRDQKLHHFRKHGRRSSAVISRKQAA